MLRRLHPFPIQPCWVIGLTLLGLGLSVSPAADLPPDQVEFFESRIRPILAQECYECHNSKDKAKGGLVLDHRAAWERGGDSGPVIVPGDPSSSLFIKSIRHEIDDLKMPKAGAQLDANVVADFTTWIAQGAPDPRDAPPTEEQLAADTNWEAIRDRRKGWWSFQPIVRPEIPEVEGIDHPVDRFIRHRLAQENLSPAPPAEPRALIRRLSFTLVGLPPTPEETAAFLASWEVDSEAATVALVDRLLADPGFGETWARHWMDWTRYADSHGSEGDPVIPHAWRYRDYLIRALNADVPYDQLLREHLAGDLLDRPRVNAELQLNESALGLGHLRMVFHGFAPTDALDERVRFTDDQNNTVTKAFLGLTVSCARCHDHKFDAISQADYYALFGIFTSGLPATIAVDAPGVLEKNRDALAKLKPAIREQFASHWLNSLSNDSAHWEKPIDSASPPDHALHLLWKLRQSGDDPDKVAAEWSKAAREFSERQTKADANRQGDAIRHRWDLSDPGELKSWNRYGEGLLDDTPAPAGEMVISDAKNDRVVDRILPSGVYSHRLSTRHRGVLASAPFDLDGEYDLYLNVAGDGSSARFAVEHYPRSGTVYPVNNLDQGTWRWLKYDRLDYWNGDRIHLELATAEDAPILVKDSPRSWFGIREAVLVKKGSPSPARPEDEFLAPLFATAGDRVPRSLADGIALYTETLRQLVTTWQTGDSPEFSDASALFLDRIVQSGLLPNDLVSLPEELRKSVTRYRELESEIPSPTRAPGIFERPGVDQALFVRGNHKEPGESVPRRFLEAIDATPYATNGTGRLEFARDLLREDNPFTARVIVNRIWHHLFSEGLVATMDNFGRLGESPSHPELLDFLAARFREDQAWSVKTLIRDLVLSKTWQQSSQPSPAAADRDPNDRLLSHFPTRRLEAEAIRDAFLSVSGQLSKEPFGQPVTGTTPRRSVYVRVTRNNLDPLLTTFDFPTPASAVGRRDVTNVPAQSLTLLNDPFIISQAKLWAGKLGASLPPEADDEARIRTLFETALTRPPTDAEITQSRDFLYALDEEHRTTAAQFAEIQNRLTEARAALSQLIDPIHARLLAEQRKAAAAANEGAAPEAIDLKPVASWNFEEDLSDSVAGLSASFKGTTKLENGAVVVDGTGFVATDPLPFDLTEKTLEVIVQLATLDQRAGGVMTVQDLQGGAFDSIVFAERRPQRWVAGSNGFTRTLDFEAPDETEAVDHPVHLAITYSSDGTIRCYRQGEPWGQAIRKAAPHSFKANETQVLFGLRHGTTAQGNRPFRGRILEARLYDRALGEDEIRATATGERIFVSQRDIDQALTDVQQDERTRLESRISTLVADLDALRRLGSDTPLEQRRWQDLAHAIFNLKEFIYLR